MLPALPYSTSALASAGEPRDHPPPPLQLSTYQGHFDHTRIFDYMQKYPADKQGKELDPEARTWKVYIDEHESYDYDMVKGFRDNIDAILVFAALFSSVVTGFVVPAAQRLEPDHTQINTYILFEATRLLRANGNATLIEATPASELRPDSVTHTSADVWVAFLFFSSLSLSLATAFVCILVKQWLQAFTALVHGDAKQRSLTRQFRFGGLERWKFSEIVGFLPLLLHLALALFLAGLCVYVHRFHPSIPSTVGFVSGAVVVFYVITSALPAVHLDCPYRIPILYIPASTCVYAGKFLQFIFVDQLWRFLKNIFSSLKPNREVSIQPSTPNPVSPPVFTPLSLSAQEREYVKQNTPHLELTSLEWLYTQTTNTSVHRIVLPALARVLDRHVCVHPGGAQPKLHIGSHLENMHSFSLAIIDRISSSESIGDDVPQLLDFYLHSSHILRREPKFQVSRWPSLICSPHLEAFLHRNLLQLDVISSVMDSDARLVMGGPLQVACHLGQWDNVKCLLHLYPPSQWTTPDSNGRLPLGKVAASPTISTEDFTDILRITRRIDLGVLKLPVTIRGDTILHVLCHHGAELAKITFADGCSWDLWNIQRASDGQTPLHRLCSRGDNPSRRVEIAKYLLSQGADMSICDDGQRTALHIASVCHFPEIIQVLCFHLRSVPNYQDVINQQTHEGRTALHLAFYGGERTTQTSAVQLLISAGADPNLVDHKNQLALHVACRVYPKIFPLNAEAFAIVLSMTVDVNICDQEGRTPLDVLLHGRNATTDWQTAYDLMREKGAKLAGELEDAYQSHSGTTQELKE